MNKGLRGDGAAEDVDGDCLPKDGRVVGDDDDDDFHLREGQIITIVITNAPLIWRGQSPSTSSPAPPFLQTLVHLLYPILVSKSGNGASRLLVVLITPCS